MKSPETITITFPVILSYYFYCYKVSKKNKKTIFNDFFKSYLLRSAAATL